MGCSSSKQKSPDAPHKKGRSATVVEGKRSNTLAPKLAQPSPTPMPVNSTMTASKVVDQSAQSQGPPPAGEAEKKQAGRQKKKAELAPVRLNSAILPVSTAVSAAAVSPKSEQEEVKVGKIVFEMDLDGEKTAFIQEPNGERKDIPVDNSTKLIYEIDDNLETKSFLSPSEGELVPFKMAEEEAGAVVENTPEGARFIQLGAADGSSVFMEITSDGNKKAALLTPDGIRRVFNMTSDECKIAYEIVSSGAKNALIVAKDGASKRYEVAMERQSGNHGFFDLAGGASKKVEFVAADGAKIAIENIQDGGKRAYIVAADGSRKIMNTAKNATKVTYELAMDGGKKVYFVAEDGAKQVYTFARTMVKGQRSYTSKTVVFDTEKQPGYNLLDGDLIKLRARVAASDEEQDDGGSREEVAVHEYASNMVTAAGSGITKVKNHIKEGELANDLETAKEAAKSSASSALTELKAIGSAFADMFNEEKVSTTRVHMTEKVYEEDEHGKMQLVSETSSEKTETTKA